MSTDVFEAADAARQKMDDATRAYEDCKKEWIALLFKKMATAEYRKSTVARIAKLLSEFSNETAGCCEHDQHQSSVDIRAIEAKDAVDKASYKSRIAGCAEQAAVARRKLAAATKLAESMRIVDLFKYRTFLRLQPTHAVSADQMVRWIDRYVRPNIIDVTVVDQRHIRYEVRSVVGHIIVQLRPFGKITHIVASSAEDATDVGFRLRDAPWLVDRSVADRFCFGRFVLMSFLTAPYADIRHAVSDRHHPRDPSWLDKREQRLLLAHTVLRKKRYQAGLLERWLPGIATVCCRLILQYVYPNYYRGIAMSF